MTTVYCKAPMPSAFRYMPIFTGQPRADAGIFLDAYVLLILLIGSVSTPRTVRISSLRTSRQTRESINFLCYCHVEPKFCFLSFYVTGHGASRSMMGQVLEQRYGTWTSRIAKFAATSFFDQRWNSMNRLRIFIQVVAF